MTAWLITGGAGFIGSNFVRMAAEDAADTLVVLDASGRGGDANAADRALEATRRSRPVSLYTAAHRASWRTDGLSRRHAASHRILRRSCRMAKSTALPMQCGASSAAD